MTRLPAPSRHVAAAPPYSPTLPMVTIEIDLAGTEGRPLDCGRPANNPQADVSHYPDPSGLAADLAIQFGVTPDRVLITAGADDALERTFRAFVDADREVILTTPTFEMLSRYTVMQGATVVSVAWVDEQFPVPAILAAITPATALIAIVTPNNPTGLVATIDQLRAIHDAACNAVLLVDLAYVEFADTDPTRMLIELPRVVIVRTMSKAWGLAGARVGYALSAAEGIGWLRRAGNPFPVSALSISTTRELLGSASAAVTERVAATKTTRGELEARLDQLGVPTTRSQANFVFAMPRNAQWAWNALASCGVATRLIASQNGSFIRITTTLSNREGATLDHALGTVFLPEAIVFDMDGVIADVSRSYREAIIRTAAHFGVAVSGPDISAIKRGGGANDDWLVTTRLVQAQRPGVQFGDVKREFERRYQGTGGTPGLRDAESLIAPATFFRNLAGRLPVAIATGRPRGDAEAFLERFGLADVFRVCVTREDGPIKPDPFAPHEAMRRLGLTRGWMVGDTPDDVRAARAARLLPLGIIAPGDEFVATTAALLAAGAASVLPSLDTLEQLLP